MAPNSMIFKILTFATLAFLASGCGRYNPFAKKTTTSIEVEVENQSSIELLARGSIQQRKDDDYCANYGFISTQSALAPGEKTLIQTSLECQATPRAFVSVYRNESYSIGTVVIRNPSIAAKLTAGIQFRVFSKDQPTPVTIEVVNAVPPSGNYDHLWHFPPHGAAKVAWLIPKKASKGVNYWNLYSSIPKANENDTWWIEFDENLGIDDFGPFQIIHENGVYRSHFWVETGPRISSPMTEGRLVCDNIGCNEIR